jgi:hypothetical protein
LGTTDNGAAVSDTDDELEEEALLISETWKTGTFLEFSESSD